ncbi:MAG: hypothetical protein Unbinned8472contig1000_43 [Prokaryotic dsDNA virus sp.]|nr:MAG: hypothetical protein Unbinned8472contig1000_43 [Prokaryotic dsDNA virus sp.]|tara:strand:+ start:238 stop:420 length:183 start_codon:yes stop_codon:yes gene_type:complete
MFIKLTKTHDSTPVVFNINQIAMINEFKGETHVILAGEEVTSLVLETVEEILAMIEIKTA